MENLEINYREYLFSKSGIICLMKTKLQLLKSWFKKMMDSNKGRIFWLLLMIGVFYIPTPQGKEFIVISTEVILAWLGVNYLSEKVNVKYKKLWKIMSIILGLFTYMVFLFVKRKQLNAINNFKTPTFFKDMQFIHVLLIILILIVFFGLFKKEITKGVMFLSPSINYEFLERVYVPCTKTIINPPERAGEKVQITCDVNKYGIWIRIFGINWRKIGEETESPPADGPWDLDL